MRNFPMNRDTTLVYKVGASHISIGRFTYGYDAMVIREWGEGASLTVGAFCSIAPLVNVFLGGNHRTDWITTYPFGHINADVLGGQQIQGHPATRVDITIGSDVWIGQGATILSGTRIGSGAVISAGAFVVRDVAPYEIVGGNPAKPLRARFDPNIVALLLELSWWDLPVATIREMAPQLSAAPNEDSIRALIANTR